MIRVITPEPTGIESASDRSGTRGIGRGGPPKVRQSVRPTERRSGPTGGFSKAEI